MNFKDWYTDTVDIFRSKLDESNNLSKYKRVEVLTGIPCRLYHIDSPDLKMTQTSANIDQKDWLQCDNSVDIQPGDMLIVHRGAGLGKKVPEIRFFAAEPNYYFEPFGASIPGLSHQEIRLLQQERVK